jgi:cobalt-zinc-cadmium efflux system membrane fusion protein
VICIAVGVAVLGGIHGTKAAIETDKTPALLHQGDRIVLPDGSPYRDRIRVANVENKSVSHRLILPATVEADPARTINILPPVTGKVVDLMVQLGDTVVKGQPLMVIDSGDLALAYADNDKAADSYRLTKSALDRARALVEARGGAIKDFQQAESDNTQALAELNRSQARLKAIGATAEVKGRRSLTLRAPISGSITALAAAPGAFANDSTVSLMTIANLESVWVTANAPENNVSFIKPGMDVDVAFPAYPDQHFSGKVSSISAVLEPDTRRTKVRISFPNKDGKFKPNMFANATFMAPQSSEAFVPTSSLLMNNDHITVFVEVASQTFERRTIEPGQESGGYAVVKQGLTPGERVIVKGGVLLND